MRYLTRRLSHALLVLAGVSVLSFLFVAAAPGEFLSEMKLDPRISPEMLTALRARYSLDDPLALKYVHWLQSVVRGDLGFSFAYNSPVTSLLWPRLRNTLLLTVPATVAAWLIAVPLGAWCASHRGRWLDRLSAVATTALLVTPELLLGLAMLVVAVRTGVFPIGGMNSPGAAELGVWARLTDRANHLVLPASALIL